MKPRKVNPLDFLAKTLLLFLALELATLLFRPIVSSFLSSVFNAQVAWECTALDETFLLLSALLVLGTPWRKIAIGVLALQCYNILRIWILSNYPDPLLHELLFRWGGFLLVVLLFWFLTRPSVKFKTTRG